MAAFVYAILGTSKDVSLGPTTVSSLSHNPSDAI